MQSRQAPDVSIGRSLCAVANPSPGPGVAASIQAIRVILAAIAVVECVLEV
jgi:hypothetical protein